MATQLAVYAAGTWLAVAQGPEAAEQMARELAMQPQPGAPKPCGVTGFVLLSSATLVDGLQQGGHMRFVSTNASGTAWSEG